MLTNIRVCREICVKYVFVTTKVSLKIMFVATNICRDQTLSRQKYTFVATKDVLCRDKHVFVSTKLFIETKMILMAAPDNDSEGANFR